MIIAITGASGVGKTTVTKEIAKSLPERLRVFHFDDIGMPDWSKVDAKKWQEETTHQWINKIVKICLLYTSPSPRDATLSRMPSSA